MTWQLIPAAPTSTKTVTVYQPASDYTTTLTTYADVDGTNLKWTFTPTGTSVLLSAQVYGSGTGSGAARLSIAVGGVMVSGSERAFSVGSGRVRSTASWLVTGLTAGTTYTYTLQFANQTSGQTTTIYGGTGSSVVLVAEGV